MNATNKNNYQRSLYAWRKENGICVRCGKTRAVEGGDKMPRLPGCRQGKEKGRLCCQSKKGSRGEYKTSGEKESGRIMP